MQRYITPNDTGIMGATDSESIQNAVNSAVKTGVGRVLIPRINERTGEALWDIDKAIILASDLEVVLDNCYIRQADGCMDNVFRSFDKHDDAVANPVHDIRIVGKGNAVIDGAVHNGLTEHTSLKDGRPHITKNNMILFFNVDHFTIEGISLIHQRWWAIDLISCAYGRLSNLHIHCECDEPNCDGIDLREGCHDIIIENITGQAGDDLIALSAIGTGYGTESGERARFNVPGKCQDLHDITIKNIIGTSVNCAVIAIRYSEGRKLYNVTIDNVHDVDNGALEAGKFYPEYPKHKINMDIRQKLNGNAPYVLLRIGQDGFWKNRNNTVDEVYGISATNLYSRGGTAIMLNIGMKNCYFGNIFAENDVDYVVTTKSGRVYQNYGADLKNVVFENIFYDNKDNKDGTAFDFDINDANNNVERTLENVVINRAFLGNCPKIFNVQEKGNIIFKELYGANVTESYGEIKN